MLLIGKPLGRARRRCVCYIKMGLGKIGRSGVDWMCQWTSGGSCEHGNEPSGSMSWREVPQ
jgi:hypothetical protein